MQFGSEFFRANFTYITEIYLNYKQNPSSVDSSWKQFFEDLSDDDKALMEEIKHEQSAVIGKRNELSSLPISDIQEIHKQESDQEKKKQAAIKLLQKENINIGTNGNLEGIAKELLNNFRAFGHLVADLDPLNITQKSTLKELEINFSQQELNTPISIANKKDTIQNHISFFKNTYTSKIGAEFHHIKNSEERNWLYSQFENSLEDANLNTIRKHNLEMLIKAESFENALHIKFPGAKRFSAEGGESVITSLEQILLTCSNSGVESVILGMAHRGRLNILTHILEKRYCAIFSEFMGVSSIPENVPGSGDVKYHLGMDTERTLLNGKNIKISLSPNPSHLESVNPVVMGRVRAKQDDLDESKKSSILPILIHGDAAMAGQGIVAECIAMSNLKGYTVQGTIHIIINNQVGFTALQKDTKSGTYSSDVAKAIDAPIIHVNGNSPEDVIKASTIAAEYRQKFKKDVVIELICYRKYGHNEGDEPMFTQPSMYKKIKAMPSVASIYCEELLSKKVIEVNFEKEFRAKLQTFISSEFEQASTYKPTEADWLKGKWSHIKRLEDENDLIDFSKTNINEETFNLAGGAISITPTQITVNSKIKKMLEERKIALLSGEKIDWATAELLAYSSLCVEGFPVRLSGEDCERGTFTHRHSIYYDQNTNERYEPLNNIQYPKAAKYEVFNSLLSEFAVLGFEYGYSLQNPNSLTIWEAQFGDFANGAVVIYDQYISSGEDKWLRMSGLVSLLPHGFEGQGPEHSSARLERYLQYAAENNIIVCNFTTPANLFHALRRQVKMPYRKPLIIMSPKSLLRNKMVISSKEEFTKESFKAVIGAEESLYKKAKKVVFTSGKVYYDLISAGKTEDVAIIRIEQYYPFPANQLKKEISKFSSVKQFAWVQEEPKNMGAWSFIKDYLEECVEGKVEYIGRAAKPSPATGFASEHKKEQDELIKKALS